MNNTNRMIAAFHFNSCRMRHPRIVRRDRYSGGSLKLTACFAHNNQALSGRPRTNTISRLMPRYISSHSGQTNPLIAFSSKRNVEDATDIKQWLLSEAAYSGATIYDVLHSSIQLFGDHSVPEPEESVLHLLSHALDLSWENGYRHLREVLEMPTATYEGNQSTQPLDFAKQILTEEQSSTLQSYIERRMRHEPLQYIIGKWDFHNLSGLKIRKPMLCPRPETEELVELVLSDITQLMNRRNTEPGDKKLRVLDVGCGTGAIGIAIARQYPRHVQVVALDVLQEAVDLSNENAHTFLAGLIEGSDTSEGVSHIYEAILCSAMDFTNNPPEATKSSTTTDMKQRYKMDFDIVVSNPPYIPTDDMRDLSKDVVGYESHKALCGGDDGLNVIRDIVHRLPEWTSSDGSRHCWMEVDDSHPLMMAKWLAPGSSESSRLGVEFRQSLKDLCGRDRFVLLASN